MNDADSAALLLRWRDGDADAATELFARYVDRLTALAAGRLSPKMKRRVDAEDVVQSAYRSFFVKAEDGRYNLDEGVGLWPLLAAITLSKVRKQVEFNTAGKRDVAEEASVGHAMVPVEVACRAPEPADVLATVEEYDRLKVELPPLHRRIVELRLEDRSVEEIAAEVGRSERTVRRVLENARRDLTERLSEISTR